MVTIPSKDEYIKALKNGFLVQLGRENGRGTSEPESEGMEPERIIGPNPWNFDVVSLMFIVSTQDLNPSK